MLLGTVMANDWRSAPTLPDYLCAFRITQQLIFKTREIGPQTSSSIPMPKPWIPIKNAKPWHLS